MGNIVWFNMCATAYLLPFKGDGEPILQVLRYIFYIQMTLSASAHGINYSAFHHHALVTQLHCKCQINISQTLVILLYSLTTCLNEAHFCRVQGKGNLVCKNL